MFPTKKQRWALVAGIAGSLGAQLAEQLLTSSWRLATRHDPPEDPAYDDVDWRSAAMWAVAAGAAVAVSQLVAQQGAGLAWRKATGSKPPHPRKRKKYRSRREALL